MRSDSSVSRQTGPSRRRLREGCPEIRYGKIKESERRIESKGQVGGHETWSSLIREEVTEDDIAAVVSKWTGIPVSRMMQSERQSYCTWKTSCTNG